ncbi:hypothetical protein PQR75_26650 [Paraburkholderia fungorum]|jgi:hypothetical protein|uniref:hypothetical protein n=1 Tax=Paraburkholderia fungorum TaxID=134537 RepID=UPI0038B96316
MTDSFQSSHGLTPGPVLCIGEFPETSRALPEAAFEFVTPAQLDAPFLRKAFIKGAGYTDDALSRPMPRASQMTVSVPRV